jgi:hypothetical protein
VPIKVPSAPDVTASPTTDDKPLLGGTGYLKVTVDDGMALAIVDGIPRGPTPVVVGLGTGSHTVSARSLDGSYVPARTTVTIGDADTTVASFHKAPAASAR